MGQPGGSNPVDFKTLIDQAVNYMAVRWLTVGSPERERISLDFSRLPADKQQDGITFKRVASDSRLENALYHSRAHKVLDELLVGINKDNRSKIDQQLVSADLDYRHDSTFKNIFEICNKFKLDLKERDFSAKLYHAVHKDDSPLDELIKIGDVPSEFLEEVTIPPEAISIMNEFIRSSFDFRDQKWEDFYVQSAGPVKYVRIEDTNFQHFPLPWHIRDSIDDKLSPSYAFFDRLEKYAGHPWGASENSNRTYFANPIFGLGMGDASANQKLYLFQNGMVAHITDAGRYWGSPGVYVPDGSIALRTEAEFFPEKLLVHGRLTSNPIVSVGRLDQDTILINRGYPGVQFFPASSVISQEGHNFSDPTKADEKVETFKTFNEAYGHDESGRRNKGSEMTYAEIAKMFS